MTIGVFGQIGVRDNFFFFFLKQFIFQSGRISNSKSGLPHHPGETVGRKYNLLYVLYTKGSIIII